MLLHCIFVRIIFYGKSAISSFVHLYLTCLFFSEIISWLKCFSVLNTFYKISDISHFLSQGSPGGSRMWTPPRAFDVAILLQLLNLRNLNSCRLSQTTCVIYDNSCILTYIFTHTHTHTRTALTARRACGGAQWTRRERPARGARRRPSPGPRGCSRSGPCGRWPWTCAAAGGRRGRGPPGRRRSGPGWPTGTPPSPRPTGRSCWLCLGTTRETTQLAWGSRLFWGVGFSGSLTLHFGDWWRDMQEYWALKPDST